MRRVIPAFVLIATVALALALASPSLAAASLSGFSATSTKVVGGKTATATVKLSAAAPSGGLSISLKSDDTSLATVSSSVTVAAGKTSATVSIKTKVVTASDTVTIKASDGDVSKSLTLTILPASLNTLSVPKTMYGGVAGKGTVSLTGAAPSGGLTVSLSASGGVASVPDSVTIAAGKTSANFAITAPAVTDKVSTTISATLGSVTKTGTVAVAPPVLSSLAFSPSSVGNGVNTTGTVKLTGSAPAGGITVELSVPDGAPFTLPSSVDIPAGALSATFTATGGGTTVSGYITVTAKYVVTKTAKVTIVPPGLSSLKLSASSIAYNGTATGTVTLTSAALPGGAEVFLSPSTSALIVPESVTVPEGEKTVTFTVGGNAPGVTTSVNVTALYNDVRKTATISVKAAPNSAATLAALVVVPDPVGSQSLIGIGVSLSKVAPSGGVPVTLTSNNQSALPLNDTFTITAGNDTLLYYPTTGTVTSDTVVTITASGAGATLTATLTIKPYVVAVLTVPANGVTGGRTTSGNVQLSGPAPAGGATVSLKSSSSAASVPSSVTIPAGSQVGIFTITTNAVSATTTVTITATAGASVTAKMTVNPLQVSGWGTFPTALKSQSTNTAVVSLNGNPPAGGAVVTLTSSNPDVASVPSSVTISSGTSALFNVTTGSVTTATNVTISASLGGKTITKVVTVSPPALSAVAVSASSLLLSSTYSGQAVLDAPAPAGGVTVQLSSSSSSAVSIPSSVTIAAGATSAAFAITTKAVTAPVTVTFTAKSGTVTKTTTVQVIPIGPWQGDLSTAATDCTSPRSYGFALSGPAPAGGLVVAITGENGIHAVASVTVPEGATGFTVDACGDVVESNRAGGLIASANGLSARYILGLPIASEGLSVDSATVTGGSTINVTFSIGLTASAGGLTTTVASNNPAVIPSFTMTVPEGAKTVTVAVAVASVTAKANVTLTTSGYWPASASLTVNPAPSGASVMSASIDEDAPADEPAAASDNDAAPTPEATATPVATDQPAAETATATPAETPTATPEPTDAPPAAGETAPPNPDDQATPTPDS